jgi:mono/diheme cytochrome c family protein
MLRALDNGLTAVSVLAAALLVVLLFAGPSVIGAKRSTPSLSPYGTTPLSGAAVFASAGCGNCHTLKAAGTSGSIGPNLDQVRPSASTVAAIVRSGGGSMPSFSGRLSTAQITALAGYVSSVAGH